VNVVRLQRVILLGLGLFAASSVGFAWHRLPLRMASHFDGRGRPDGYMSREAFFSQLAVVGGGTVVLLLLIPALLRFVPSRAINMPHRDYWLAPERRAQTLERIAIWGGWFAIATGALLVVVLELTLRANVAGTNLDGTAANIGIGLYVVGTLISLVRLIRQFGKPPSSHDSSR
jgi:uncharacterized membrane protein